MGSTEKKFLKSSSSYIILQTNLSFVIVPTLEIRQVQLL
ncbi:hypothetical protein LEP1GSC176_0044 [Leptospira kirschneri str. MMD1493]|nr:hypothetical protein LEP1GSC176_0044 [Leptospira kirschneri str. MMD1493]